MYGVLDTEVSFHNYDQMEIKEEVVVKEELDEDLMHGERENLDSTEREKEGDIDFIDVDGGEGEISKGVRTDEQPQQDPLFFKASLFTKTNKIASKLKDQQSVLNKVTQEK